MNQYTESLMEEYVGMKFGLLTVVGPTERRNSKGRTLWEMSCECGSTYYALLRDLFDGTKSCGCIRKIQGPKHDAEMIGLRIGKLTVVCKTTQRLGPDSCRGQFLWEMVCDCGNQILLTKRQFLQQTKTSCGCDKYPEPKPGDKYNMLTFIAPTEYKRKKQVLWALKCDCGSSYRALPANVILGRIKSCGCERPELNRRNDPKLSTANTIWKHRYSDCSWDTFITLSQEPCYYCGVPPQITYNVANQRKNSCSQRQIEEGNFTYNGLDRLDSSRGHEDDNVVPCCFNCNRMKMNKSPEEFLECVRRIYVHSLSKG
jgi:hypothetical protein